MKEPVHQEIYEATELVRHKWMRRRFLGLCLFLAFASSLNLLGVLLPQTWRNHGFLSVVFGKLVPYIVALTAYLIVYYRVRQRLHESDDAVHWGDRLLTVAAGLSFFLIPFFSLFYPDRSVQQQFTQPSHTMWRVMGIHFFASLFLPWTVREAIKGLVILMVFAIPSAMLFTRTNLGHYLILILTPLMGVPGLMVCWLRNSRFRKRVALEFLTGRYSEVQQELEQARKIHDMLFPSDLGNASVRLVYRYEPMREIGGDYLYTRTDREGCLNVVVIDVTGHGIVAALAVNRLYGELDRLFGEQGIVLPHDIIRALNHYFILAMSKQGLFATAFAVRVNDSAQELEWANAGHPPALMIRSGQALECLDSHTIMLGVLDDEQFSCDLQVTPLNSGDRLVVYTDGVTEACNRQQEMLDIDGFTTMLQNCHQEGHDSLAEPLQRKIQHYRSGPPTDDTLIVELFKT